MTEEHKQEGINEQQQNSLLSNEDFRNLMDEKLTQTSIDDQGSVVKGVVISINEEKQIVTVDVGLKSEGVVDMKEFLLNGNKQRPQVGEEVEVFLRNIDNRFGNIVLSREQAIKHLSWQKIKEAFATSQSIDGIIFSRVKGGLSVDIDGVIGFLPGSQVDIRPVKDPSILMGHKQSFKILNVDEGIQSVIVSRKAILQDERSGESDKFFDSIKEGDVLDGVVKNITNYGAFIDLGSIDGLLHITDITWDRISHPSEILQLGQKIKVKVIKYDTATKRLSLGMRQLTDNPWAHLQEKYPVGKRVKGPITNVSDYGIFVKIEDGVEGLVHVSEISWTKDGHKELKLMEIGSEVETIILNVDVEKHRIALGVKQLSENPWKVFAETHKLGDTFEGEIRNIADFGLFVSLGNGIDGLVYLNDISWGGDSMEKLRKYKVGEKVKVMYLGSDYEKQRVSLGIKQLEEDPFSQHGDSIKKNELITCTVSGIRQDGIEVEVISGVYCFIKKNDLAREKVEQRPERFVVGDKIDAKVVMFDPDTRKIALSIKAHEEDEHRKIIQEYGSVDSGASLGNILGKALKVDDEQ